MSLGNGALSRTVWVVSLPLVFAEISETLIHVIDTVLLGRVGTTELAALAVADIIFEIWIVATVGLVDGMQILISRRAGERRDRALGDAFNQGLLIVILTSLVLTVAMKLTAPFLSDLLVGSEEVAAAVNDFLQIAAYGIVFISVGFAYSALYVGLSRTRALVGATVVLALTNIGLGYVLIFGKLGFPELGMEGAAIAFVGAEFAMFVFLTAFTLWRMDAASYGLFRIRSLDRTFVRSLVRISSPAASQGLLEGSQWLAFFLIIGLLGPEPLASANIIYACFAIFLIPSEGFGETTVSMVSRFIGRNQRDRIGLVVRKVISSVYLTTMPFVAVAALFPEAVLSVFTSNPEIVEGSAGGLRIAALAMFVVIPAEAWFAALFGTGDTRAALGIQLALTAVMVGASYVAAIVLDLSVTYVWLSIPIAWLMVLALSYAWVRGGRWERRQI